MGRLSDNKLRRLWKERDEIELLLNAKLNKKRLLRESYNRTPTKELLDRINETTVESILLENELAVKNKAIDTL